MLSPYLLIGEILKPQGLNGQVKLRPLTDDPRRFSALDHAYFCEHGEYRRVTADAPAVRGEFAFLRLDGASSREDAEKQRGQKIYIDRDSAAVLNADANFIEDLIGCAVVGTDGSAIGKLTDIMQPGANDVYVIQTPRGELLLPALKAVVPSVDAEARVILVDADRLPAFAVWQDEKAERDDV